jgi:hypothetical protein
VDVHERTRTYVVRVEGQSPDDALPDKGRVSGTTSFTTALRNGANSFSVRKDSNCTNIQNIVSSAASVQQSGIATATARHCFCRGATCNASRVRHPVANAELTPTICNSNSRMHFIFRNGHAVSYSAAVSAIEMSDADVTNATILRNTTMSQTGSKTEDAAHASVFQRARLRSIQVAATTVGCFVLCWTPFYVYQCLILAWAHNALGDGDGIGDSVGSATMNSADGGEYLHMIDIVDWLTVVGLTYIIVHPLLYGAVKVRSVRRRLHKLLFTKPKHRQAAIT